jgi:hypothetical protein
MPDRNARAARRLGHLPRRARGIADADPHCRAGDIAGGVLRKPA